MTAKELFLDVFEKAKEFGLTPKNDRSYIKNPKGNAIIREKMEASDFSDGSAFFAFISNEEEPAGLYSDFSFVVFPDNKECVKQCVVCLGVGSSGFRNDFQLASLPGLRRLFLKLKTENAYFKTSFEDIESTSSDLLNEIKGNFPLLQSVIDRYKTVLPASQIVYMDDKEKALDTIYMWLATYAKMRVWGTAAQKRAIETQLEKLPLPKLPDDENEIIKLLDTRKYVVIQGAPGTGKTYTALKIAERYNKVFFEQFHAETNYSDFVYGLEPDTTKTGSQLMFKPKEGILYQAIKYAQDHSREQVLLIIDEMNRANLSSVLGPVFYLFEYQTRTRSVKTKVGDIELEKLPDNIKVVATMNTADRSLAVVDFALRRRFAWYTLRPREIKAEDGKVFVKKMYKQFADIFFEYATDDELNLQPGQSYFIVDKTSQDEEMKERMIYELMPLIKEYLAEGYLLKAKDSFCDLFLKETGRLMYE